MRSDEFESFAEIIGDLCAAYDRPATDERKRVFWDSLKHLHIHDVRRAAEKWRGTQRKMPTPVDLKPERPTAPPPQEPDLGPFSTWAMAANKILMALAYFDERRGFRPLGKELLNRVLDVKADYVRMAEDAERAGQRWDEREFNAMCREGFEALLGAGS